jgi:hypothetical protein
LIRSAPSASSIGRAAGDDAMGNPTALSRFLARGRLGGYFNAADS